MKFYAKKSNQVAASGSFRHVSYDKEHRLCLALINCLCQLLAEKGHRHRKSRENWSFEKTDM